MPESTSTNNDTTDRDEPTELRDAQKRIRDAYFDHDAGLHVLNCNPGAGKSVTITHVAAEELAPVRRRRRNTRTARLRGLVHPR